MESEEHTRSPAETAAAADYIEARSLLSLSPLDSAHVLAGLDETQLGFVWLAWLDQADAIADFAGNTRVGEVLARSFMAGIIGVAVCWPIFGFPLAWIGVGIVLAVVSWWLIRRRAWHRAGIQHVVWGALINSEYKQRYRGDETEAAKAMVDKVEVNVTRFVRNWETWVGHPVMKRVG